MPLAQVNGIDLYHEETGAGPPLLLLNGLGGTTLGWAALLPELAERFRVVAFDARGAGRSSVPPGPYTTRLLADDAVALLDHLGVARAHVVGLSLGAAVGQELALAHPERVERLVLIGGSARVRPAVLGRWVDTWVQAVELGLDAVGRNLWMMPWFLTPAFMAQHDLVEAALGEMLNDPYPTSPQGLAAQAAAVHGHDTRDRLPRIAAPTLVLVGAEDIVTPVADARELADGIPGARLQVLERCGHVPDLEDQQAVTEALLSFLVE